MLLKNSHQAIQVHHSIIGQRLAPYFTQVIIDDLVESKLPFSVHFDETTTKEVKGQMDLTQRYWFPRYEEI